MAQIAPEPLSSCTRQPRICQRTGIRRLSGTRWASFVFALARGWIFSPGSRSRQVTGFLLEHLLLFKKQRRRSVALDFATKQCWTIDLDRLPRARLKPRDTAPEQPHGYTLSLRGREQVTLSSVALLAWKRRLTQPFWNTSATGSWTIGDPMPGRKSTHGLWTAGYVGSGPSGEAEWEQSQCVYLALRSAKVEAQVDTTGKVSEVCGRFHKVLDFMPDRVEVQGFSNGSVLCPKPTPPQDGIHLPTEGGGMPLIGTLTRPKRGDLASEYPHAVLLGQTCMQPDVNALEVDKLSLVTLNDLRMSRSSGTYSFSAESLGTTFFPVNQPEENGYESSHHT